MSSSTDSWANSDFSSSNTSEASTLCTEQYLLLAGVDVEILKEEYILVVGGLGYIGPHTVLELAKAGHNVVIVDNLSNAFRSVFEKIEMMVACHFATQGKSHKEPLLRFYEADFTDTENIAAILQSHCVPVGDASGSCYSATRRTSTIEGVIHFAAYKAVDESLKFPLKYYSNNIGGLINFCVLLNDFGIKKLVFSSSATVYGTVADLGFPLREEYFESGCSGLTNPYGRTKWMCEAILSDLAAADPEWKITALRYFNPIGCDESGLLGEDPRAAASNLMPVVLRVMRGEMPILHIYGDDYETHDGTAVRDYIHVTDLARGHLASLNSKSKNGFQVYNLGTGRGHSVLEVVSAMEAVSNCRIQTRLVDRRQGDVGSCIAKPDKAEQELGWKVEKSFETCCKDIWRFLERVSKDGGEI